VDVNIPLAVALQLAPTEYLTDFTPQVWLNTPIMNLMRAGDQYPDRYDLQAAAEHELAEVLGIGGGGSSASDVLGDRLPFDLDLFRYNAPGSRVFHGSYPPSGNGIAYFSIDGGVTNIINFNGTYSDGDGGDWFPADGLEYVQNFNGTGVGPHSQVDLALPELTALDIVGWDLAVPEPSTAVLFCLGGLCMAARRPARRNLLCHPRLPVVGTLHR
jgi:hypothetical protein